MAYQSKFTGAEVDSLLEKVQKGEAGGSVTVDSSLSTTSENPVMNKVITEGLNKKLEGEVIGTTSPTEGTIEGARDSHNIGSIDLFEQIIDGGLNHDLTQEDKDAILSGKIITTSAGNVVVPTISSNSMGENGAVLIFHFNERLYEMFVMWSDTRCYINGVLSFTKDTKLYADSELSETSENAVQNKVVTEKLTELSAEVNELRGDIFGGKEELNLNEKLGKMYLENGTIYDNASSLYADVDLSAYEGKTLVITLSNIYSQSERYTGIAVNGKFVTNFAEKRYTQPVEYVIPANAHLWASHHNTSTMKAEIVINGLVQDDNADKEVVYVAKNGSDDNEGTEGKPFATIQKAINSRASRIYIGGGIYAETLDLGNYDKKKIEILKKDSFSEVIIEKTPTNIATSDGTLVDGTTSVYMLPNVSGITADMRYLVQVGIPYGAISQEERRPEQRGRATRLNDTFIRKIRSISSIDGAVAEIERALTEDGRYMYHLDGTTLYYSRPSALSATNPLVRPTAKATLFNNVTSGMTFIMTGIHTRFLEFNIDMSVNSVITDCISEFALGAGAFTYDGSLNMTFRRCEASCCCQGSTGDGFNGHADNVTGYADGDAEAKCCTCRLEQCWSHDNYDDGFSDHQRCESNVIGGLYEYNGKGGIVPSYGSHCTCYNVESRHNCNGFLSTGTPDATEGGEGTQLTCYNCIASDNTNQYGQNYAGNVAETNAGFAAMNYRCKLIAVQCLAKGNKLGFFTNSEGGGKDGYSELIDCRALNNSQSSWYPKSKPEITIITNSETL